MKKLLLIFLIGSYIFAFDTSKVENLMGEEAYQTYNPLLGKIFVDNNNSIENIVSKLKNNGLLKLFFNQPKVIQTKFIFVDNDDILNTRILHNTLISLGYYYFYPLETIKEDNKFILDIEFKSEHFIDPVSFIHEIQTRGCKVVDIYRENDLNSTYRPYSYKIKCNDIIVKDSHLLTDENMNYIKASGIYWIQNDDFSKILIDTKKIDSWHPSVWFYDDKLNLLNNIKINQKTTNLTLKIPASCKYIKIIDIYSAENFKRGIIVKGLK